MSSSGGRCPCVQQDVLRAQLFSVRPSLTSRRVFLYVRNVRDALLVPVWTLLEQQQNLGPGTLDLSSLPQGLSPTGLPVNPVPVPIRRR